MKQDEYNTFSEVRKFIPHDTEHKTFRRKTLLSVINASKLGNQTQVK